jgi:hypothetical protein
MDPAALGFDPNLAAHAAGSLPLYAACFAMAKRLHVVNERVEMLVAMLVTAGVNAGVALGGGTAPLFPALSTATVGAVGAMIAHSALFKRARDEK